MGVIGTLSARIMADAAGVTAGMGLTRAELKLTRQAFLDSRTDADKLQTALDLLGRARDKGAYKSEQDYAAAVAEVRRQLDPAVAAEQQAAAAAKQLADAVDQSKARLQEQIATLGMDAAALERHKLAQQGATQAQVAEVAALQQQLAAKRNAQQAATDQAAAAQRAEQQAAAAAKQLAEAVGNTKARLQEQITTLGLNSAELERHKLAQQGASQAQIAEVATLQQQLAAKKAAQQAEADASAAAQRRVAAAEQERAAKIAEGKRMTDAARPAIEGYQQKLERLQSMRGYMSLDAYGKAMRDMRVDMIQAIPVVGSLFNALQQIPIVGSLARSALTAGPLGMILGGAAGAAAAGLGMLKSAWSGAGERLGEQKEAKASARRLGVDPEEYLRLSAAAAKYRVEVTAVETALYKSNEKVGEAMQGGEEARKTFDRMGLSWQKLAQLAPEQQFFVINAAIQKHATGAERAAAAQDVYGKAVREIAPLLSLTAAEYDKLSAKQREAGIVLSAPELARIDAANAKIKESKEAWKGLTNTLSPMKAEAEATWAGFSGSAYRGLTAFVRQFGDVRAATLAAAPKKDQTDATAVANSQLAAQKAQEKAQEEAAKVAQQFRDEVQKLDEALKAESYTLGMTARQAEIWKLQQKGLSDFDAGEKLRYARQIEARKLTFDTTQELTNQIVAFQKSADVVKRFELALQGVNREQLSTIARLQNVRQVQEEANKSQEQGQATWWKTWETARRGQLESRDLATGRSSNTVPKDTAASEANELRRQWETRREIARMAREGAFPEEQNRILQIRNMTNEFERQSEALQRRQKLMDDSRAAAESVRNPEQIYADQLRKYQEMLDAGGVTLEQYRRLQQRAQQEMSRGIGGDRRAGVEAVRFGSAQAADAAWGMQRQFQMAQQQAAIEARVNQERAGAGKAPIGAAQADPKQQAAQQAAYWEKQLSVLNNLLAAIERLERSAPTIAKAGR